MAKDINKLMLRIDDDQIWESVMEQSEAKLVVIDIHQEWCGCCEAIHPSIARIFLDYDDCEERFLYASASIAKVGSRITAILPSDCNINLDKNGCLPLFGVFRHRSCLMIISGVDSPTLLQQIAQNMPEKPAKE